jgi:tripartite ATP-independent transporter DctP family solute receptor
MTTVSRKTAMASAAVFATINVVRAPAQAAQFQYKMGSNVPIDDPRNTGAVTMWKNVYAQSGGRLDVKLYPNAILGGDTAMLSQVRSGALEFMSISAGILGVVVPVSQIADVPFAWKSEAVALGAFDGALGEYVRGEIAARGLVPMPRMLDSGFRQVTTSTKAIRTADDLAGIKIRVPNSKLWVDLFRSLGAVPAAFDVNELYTAMQTKAVDGEENTYHAIESLHFFEVQKYLSITNHIWDGVWVVANPEAWKALDPDLQKIVQINMNAFALAQRRENLLFNNAVADKLQRQGLLVNTADAATFRAKLGGFYPHWKSEFGSQAWDLLERYAGRLG